MLTLGDALSEMELRKDLLVEVEGYRQARLATGREMGWQVRVLGTAASRGVRRLMVRLGCFLEACGRQLQRWFAVESRRPAG
jgi:hypothetical protein